MLIKKEIRVHVTTLKSGICKTPEFEKKGLASYAVNCGTKCGHNCLYCSTGAMLRMHRSFKEFGENPFINGYAIVDPTTPERVAKDAKRIKNRGMIQLCTTVDAWAPEAQEHNLGRRCLEAILAESDWTVRILTKNAAVVRDFDLISKYKDRVLIGISLTATSDKDPIMSIIEPNASPISERMEVLKKAHEMGLRTYGMLCPLLPGIADSAEQIDALVKFCVDFGAEEIFAEAINNRGNGLKLIQQALEENGYASEAARIMIVRCSRNWSEYTKKLISNLQRSMATYSDIDKLRFLLYPKKLELIDRINLENNDQGVVWL
jgi:DNA repair photolyase